MKGVTFEDELARVLPLEIPHRERLIAIAGRHLTLVAAANETMNLTRIASPQEAAIKHVLDSVLPWRHFRGANRVLDAGTGAGFPGVPLAITLPEVRFLLAESIGKKARFLEAAIEELGLPNVDVRAERAESVAVAVRCDVITARAVASVERLADLFRKQLTQGCRLLLYKGPGVEQKELSELVPTRFAAEVVERYELPADMGARTVVSVRAQRGRVRSAS